MLGFAPIGRWAIGDSATAAIPSGSTVTGVTISPIGTSGPVTFTAMVNGSGSPSQAVTWTTTGGTIAGGVFVPPAATGIIQTGTVTARSVQDPSFSASASFIVPALVVPGAVTDADFQAWLESDDAIPNVLVEAFALVAGVLTPFYWSTCGYMSAGLDSPAFYEPAISTGIPFTESLSLTSGATIAASDLEIDNTNGIREAWTGYIWTNQPIRAYVGDLRWSRADYRAIYAGVSGGLARKSDRTLALHLRDMTQRLNAPMTEHKLGGTTPNQDSIIPLAFGECHNVTGLLSNPVTLERAFHDGPMEAIKEVRANALPVDVTAHADTGRCALAADNQSASITASIQGDKFGGVYRNTIGALVQRIVTGYGNANDRYTLADIDVTNIAAFDAAHPQPVGLFVNDRTNLLVACDMLASSVGAQLSPARDGTLRLIQLALPASGTSTDVRPEHIVLNSLRPVQHIDPIAAVKLGFCRNWTVQTGLTSAISDVCRDLFETEWLTETVVDADRQRDLKLEADPVQRNTMLLRRVDANAEAARELALWGPGRDIYEFEGLPPMLQLKLGQPVTIYNDLYGMAAGKIGQVVMLTPDWDTRRVVVRFLA